MEEKIKQAQKLLKEALALRPTNPRKAKKLVAEAVRILVTLFPKAPVGPEFPEGPFPQDGGKKDGEE
ncbi:MAG: hypothetical protein JNK48_09105 [Bryobacterales bacterium]|nr:hypothetical protein [Bryobacterales bacterium]